MSRATSRVSARGNGNRFSRAIAALRDRITTSDIAERNLRLFADTLRQQGMAVYAERGLESPTAYVPVPDRSLRSNVTAAQMEVVRRYGELGFDVIILYPEDLALDQIQRLLHDRTQPV